MRVEEINRNAEFKRIYKKGTPFIGKYIIVYVFQNKRSHNRIGITVSKKLGSAVIRNRVRRMIAESYRLSGANYKTGYDFVFVGRGRSVSVKMQDIMECMNDIFLKNGLVEEIYINGEKVEKESF